MAGTITGGKQAAQTNKTKYGEDFYAVIGSKGGKNATKPKGFAYAKLNLSKDDPRHPSRAGNKGGQISRRTKATNGS